MSEVPYIFELILGIVAFCCGYGLSNREKQNQWNRKKEMWAEALDRKSKYEQDVNKNNDRAKVYKELADNIRFLN